MVIFKKLLKKTISGSSKIFSISQGSGNKNKSCLSPINPRGLFTNKFKKNKIYFRIWRWIWMYG